MLQALVWWIAGLAFAMFMLLRYGGLDEHYNSQLPNGAIGCVLFSLAAFFALGIAAFIRALLP